MLSHSLAGALIALGTALALAAPARSAQNELAVGKQAKIVAPLVVPINKPAVFNWKSRDEILEMRRQAVARAAKLVNGTYEPSPAIFERIMDNKPWWGIAGSAVFGRGARSIEGFAEESRFVLNPFLLVGANPATLRIWREDRITEHDINNPDFPFLWPVERLQFDAKNSLIVVDYNVAAFLEAINSSGKVLKEVITPHFSLVAYNARDFGYNYIWFNTDQSINIVNQRPSNMPVRIRQMIHCGGSCGYPGSCCNNMSPFTPEIDRLTFTKLPARAVIGLWKDEPVSKQQRPDFLVVIDLH